MSVSVSLAEVVEAMQVQHEEMAFYLDRKTGRIGPVFDEELSDFDTEDDTSTESPSPDGDLEDPSAWARAVETDTEGRFVPLPDGFDIHEWEMMKRFALRAGEDHADALLDAIHGRGAFRMFKDVIHRRGLADAWYAFRDTEYEEIARAWAESNAVKLIATAPAD